MSGSDCQDWSTVTVRGGPSKTKKAAPTATHFSAEAVRTAKLDHSTDGTEIKTRSLDHDSRQAMLRARVAKKLSQSELAKKLSMPLDIIKGIESGHVVPNDKQMTSINRELGITLKYAPR